MKRLAVFTLFGPLAVALLCLGASETLANRTGKTASGVAITFSQPVLISKYDESTFPNQSPSERADRFTFSGGTLPINGAFRVSWSPNDAELEDTTWIASDSAAQAATSTSRNAKPEYDAMIGPTFDRSSSDGIGGTVLIPNLGIKSEELRMRYTTFLELLRRNTGNELEAVRDPGAVIGPIDTLHHGWGYEVTVGIGRDPIGTSAWVDQVIDELNAGLGRPYFRKLQSSGARWVFDCTSVDFRKDRSVDAEVQLSPEGNPLSCRFAIGGRFVHEEDFKERLRKAIVEALLLYKDYDPALLSHLGYDDAYFEKTAFSADFLDLVQVLSELPNGRDFSKDDNVVNRSPVANPGGDLEARVNDSVTMSSAGALDPDGTIAAVEWSQIFAGKLDAEYVSPNAVTIADRHAAAFVFTPKWPGNYQFLLTVRDAEGATSSATVDVRVRWNRSPFQIKGLCEFARYFDDEDLTTFVPGQLRDYHDKYAAEWIEISPYWWMEGPTSTSVHPLGDWYSGCPGYTIAEPRMGRFIEIAHSAGLKVFLRPTLEFHNWSGFRGDLSPANWKAWFASYQEYVVHYATLADDWGVEMFSVGNELHNSEAHTQEWNDIIAQVRRVYSGTLTYTCTGMYLGASRAAFWDKLDVIGVDYYPPITGSGPGWRTGFAPMDDPPYETYVESIHRNLLQYIYPTYLKYNKPVLISETGCPNYEGVNHVLTGSPESLNFIGRTMDNTEQTQYLEAIFQNAAANSWICGVFVFHNEVLADYNYQLADIPIGFDIKHRPLGGMIPYWFGETAK